MLTPEQLIDLRTKAQRATVGPWVKTYWDSINGRHRVVSQRIENEADTDFIVAANPEVILNMLAMIEQFNAEADWLAKQCSDNIDHAGVTAWRHIAGIYTAGD